LLRLLGGLSECIGHAFYRGKSFASRTLAAGQSRTNKSRLKNGARDGRRRFRQLHQYLRMRSGLPRRDQRQFHRKAESRICESELARVSELLWVEHGSRVLVSASRRNSSVGKPVKFRTRTSEVPDQALHTRAWRQDRHL